MNYAQARQRNDKSGWAFTIQNDNDVWTAPCCRTEEKDEDGYRAHKHATREEAESCFNAWRRDPEGIDLAAGTTMGWMDCRACGAPTKKYATHNGLGGWRGELPLCDDHLTVEDVQAQISDVTSETYS